MLKIYYLSSEINPFSDSTSLSSFSKEFSITLQNDKENDTEIMTGGDDIDVSADR